MTIAAVAFIPLTLASSSGVSVTSFKFVGVSPNGPVDATVVARAASPASGSAAQLAWLAAADGAAEDGAAAEGAAADGAAADGAPTDGAAGDGDAPPKMNAAANDPIAILLRAVARNVPPNPWFAITEPPRCVRAI